MRKPPKNKSELRFAAIEIRNVLRYFLLNYLRGKTPSQRFFEHLGVTKPNTIYVEHHMAHGMSASLFSGLAKGLSISMDGKGDGTSVMVATFKHLAIQDKRKSIFHVTKRFDPRFSLGLSYSGFTKFLGFEPNDAEYKVMGLASYGSPNISLEKIYGYSRNGKPTRKVAPFVYNWRKSRHLPNFLGFRHVSLMLGGR